jgi:hypothetical protein
LRQETAKRISAIAPVALGPPTEDLRLLRNVIFRKPTTVAGRRIGKICALKCLGLRLQPADA